MENTKKEIYEKLQTSLIAELKKFKDDLKDIDSSLNELEQKIENNKKYD